VPPTNNALLTEPADVPPTDKLQLTEVEDTPPTNIPLSTSFKRDFWSVISDETLSFQSMRKTSTRILESIRTDEFELTFTVAFCHTVDIS
jgi:hypothetical protein